MVTSTSQLKLTENIEKMHQIQIQLKMPQSTEALGGATVSTSFSLPISQAAACGSAASLPPPMKTLCRHYSIFRRDANEYGPRGKASFPFKLQNSDSCCRNMFGNIYGPHKVLLIDRSDIAYLLHRLHFELVSFITSAFVPLWQGT